MKRKVINGKYLPTKLPVTLTVVTLIGLDHWHSGDIVRGATYVLLFILWSITIYLVCTEEKMDL